MLRSIVHRGPDGAGHRHRPALLDRHAAPRDHRCRHRRPTALQRRPQPRARLQRRDLQPRGAPPRARSQGPPVRHRPLRHRSDPARLRGMGPRRRRPPHRACSRSRSPTTSKASCSSPATGSASSRSTTSTVRAGFAFASELKALFQDARVPRQPDLDVLRRFLLFRVHDDGEDTFFDGVKRLLPGHTMLVRPDGIVKIERYWNPPVNPEFASSRSDDDYAQEFAQPLRRRRRAATSSPTCRSASRSRAGSTRAASSSTMARLMSSGTDLHTEGLYTFSALYPGREHRRERVHPRGRACGRQHPALRVPAARRVLERDRRVDLVPGGADDRVGAVRVLLACTGSRAST